MISRSTMGRKNHSHGCQIIYKQWKYSGARRKQQCKVYSYTSPVQQGHG
jgi:hypothetical protein